MEKEVKSYQENWENVYLAMKTPKASGALSWAPDPMPRYACFAHLTPLCYVGKIGRTRAGAPPLDQILDPLLHLGRKLLGSAGLTGKLTPRLDDM